MGVWTAALLLTAAHPAAAQFGMVFSHQKISDTERGFTGVLDNSDVVAAAMASLGDLDGDGVAYLARGAWFDDDGGSSRGAVWVLFLNSDGTTKSHQKISSTEGGFTGDLDDSDFFRSSMASLGDLDRDGVGDLAVGAIGDDDGGRKGVRKKSSGPEILSDTFSSSGTVRVGPPGGVREAHARPRQ